MSFDKQDVEAFIKWWGDMLALHETDPEGMKKLEKAIDGNRRAFAAIAWNAGRHYGIKEGQAGLIENSIEELAKKLYEVWGEHFYLEGDYSWEKLLRDRDELSKKRGYYGKREYSKLSKWITRWRTEARQFLTLASESAIPKNDTAVETEGATPEKPNDECSECGERKKDGTLHYHKPLPKIDFCPTCGTAVGIKPEYIRFEECPDCKVQLNKHGIHDVGSLEDVAKLRKCGIMKPKRKRRKK